MIVGIDPKVDYAFKHLLGREATRAILIDVIDKVLKPAPGHEIQEIEVLNPFNAQEAPDDKLSILDIKARDQSGRRFNIEMQMLTFPFYDKRILYYWSFLNHALFPEVPDYHLRFCLLETKHHLHFAEDIEFHMLELPKFAKSGEELQDDLDVWLYFLRNAETMDMETVPAVARHPLVVRALEELKMLARSDIERERYESRRKLQLDINTGMHAARIEGEKKGLIEGEKIGEIRSFQRMLNRPQTPREQLASMSLDDLTRLADELSQQLPKPT